MTTLMQTTFSRISTFTRFKLSDDSGPFVKVGQSAYENSNGDVIAITPSARVFQVTDKYEGGGGSTPPPGPVFPVGATHYWPSNALGTSPDLIGGIGLVAGAGVTLETGPLDNALGVNNAVADWWAFTSNLSNLVSNTGGTVSCWSKSSIDQQTYFTIGQYATTSANDIAWRFDQQSSPSVSAFGVGNGITLEDLEFVSSATSDGQWHNWVFVRAVDDSTVKIYLDGVLIATVNITTGAGPFVASVPFKVGFDDSNPAIPVSVSDIATWGRPLTDSEITTLYNSGTPLRPT